MTMNGAENQQVTVPAVVVEDLSGKRGTGMLTLGVDGEKDCSVKKYPGCHGGTGGAGF